jgi:hypothetical protein
LSFDNYLPLWGQKRELAEKAEKTVDIRCIITLNQALTTVVSSAMPIDPTHRDRADDMRRLLRDEFDNTLDPAFLERYISDLLPKELECARSDYDLPSRLPEIAAQGGTLVLLVGFSMEPLLQSIAVYKPANVVPILNRSNVMTPNELYGLLRVGIDKLHPRFLVAGAAMPDNPVVLDADNPVGVFQALRRELIPRLRIGERLILDITGGKKSMVAGAILFAAFAGVKISYVDFDEYDPANRVPLGFTCRIGELANPYEIFRLRDWQSVRELYERHSFHAAGRLLDRIIAAMGGWFAPDEIEAAEKLRKAMVMYELWDNGDFSGAYDTGVTLNMPLPAAVATLGENGYWPRSQDAQQLLDQLRVLEEGTDTLDTLYLDDNKLVIYVLDELDKIRRLIDMNEDFRSALLRAGGITEILLRARMLLLLKRDELEVAVNEVAGNKDPNYQPSNQLLNDNRVRIREAIIRHESVYPILSALKYDPSGNNEARGRHMKIYRGEFRLRRSSTSPSLPDDAVLGKEKDLRNKATHTYLSVSREIAARTLAIAWANANDYIENWIDYTRPQLIGAPLWSQLCSQCGVDFLAPESIPEDPPNAVAAGR